MNRAAYCLAPFFVLLAAVIFVPAAYANCVIRYSDVYFHAGLPRTVGNFSSKPECQAQITRSSASDPSFSNNARCECTADAGTGPAVANYGSASNNIAVFGMQQIIGGLMQGALSQPQDNSAEIAKQKAAEAEKKAAEEQARQDLIRKQEKEKREQTEAEAARKEANAKFAASLAFPDDSGQQAAVSDDFPREAKSNDKLVFSAGNYDTAYMSARKRSVCAANFSKLADAAMSKGDAQEAKFLNDQADKVLRAEMIDRPCDFGVSLQVPVPHVKEVPPEELQAPSAGQKKGIAKHKAVADMPKPSLKQ